VAIVGAGPSAFYAAGALVKADHVNATVDFFERLIAPHGLVRYGVAPDHQNIKSVSKVYERTAAEAKVRYFGNVEFGKDVMLDDLLAHYDQVVFAVGAQSDRQLGIPGEELPNSMSATEFVAWYNGHPDYEHLDLDLSCESAVVVGVGNVAMDVARILAKSVDELMSTDIADHALERLAASKIKDIYILSRRGPAQVKFTNAEIREFGHLQIADPIVTEEDLAVDPDSAKSIAEDTAAQKNIDYLHAYAEMGVRGKPRRVHFRFLISPVEIVAGPDGKIQAVRCEHNRLERTASGDMRAVGTGVFETIPAGMVLRSVGYRSVPLPGVPFNQRSGAFPNEEGRIVDEQGNVVPRLYVVGWAKRGPTGVIGTNKPDAIDTVQQMIADAPNQAPAPNPDPQAIVRLLQERGVNYVTGDEWNVINDAELRAGKAESRPRVKIVAREAMLQLLRPAVPAAEKMVIPRAERSLINGPHEPQ
jgi:ferredoxin--NADP+ reductase